ncbi:MAG TPA: DUF6655 family protein [Verrucomicrobiae bacterium]|nr:DUF6655 family protein [Verrucomicrobiae bacterium]
MKWKQIGFTALFASVAFCGCIQTNMTNPKRSATEQLLLSTAGDRALKSVDLATFTNKLVYVSTNYFQGYDSANALGAIRDALSSAGARLAVTLSNSDYIVEPRSGADSVDYSSTLIGLPSTESPVPLSGAVVLPEIALYKSQYQFSIAKFELLAYARVSGEHYFSSGPMVGRAHNKYYELLGFITWTRTDLPDKHKKKKHTTTQ